ncbi:MFS transporter [Nonomuraea endophytica]|uniref:Putative MFS family arabinose efflux permease n=1 Tax=Nonomuraea endophytica TaxID=714136 RepID=A0A7W8EFB6_9ACTN|nr:MFS transporter [Nonomuraea endophytica]MBB5076302.1 putative MFS family arabinose efflux permease [Nonomuraea endophytica]
MINAQDRAPYGWTPLVVLFIVGLVDRIEFNLLSGVLPLVQAEWGFSDTAAGSIPTAAALAAAVVALPAGYFADRYNRTRILAVVVFLWAIATLGSGLATGFAMFYLMRVFLAAAENIDNPAAGSLLADWYPPLSRAKAYGLTRVTTYLGGIGTLLGGVLGQAMGWRNAFLVMVIPGVLTAILCWMLREPKRGELDRLVAGGTTPASPAKAPKQPFWPQFRLVLRNPTLMFVCVGLALLTLGLAGIFFWLPTLMVRAFGATPATAGSYSGLITVAGTLVGTLVGAWLGRKWHGTIKGGRLLAGGGGITIGAAVLAAALSMNSLLAMAALTLLACSLMSIAIPNMTACLADVVGAGSRGLGFAVLQVFTTAGGAFGSLIVGIFSDRLGSLVGGMYVLIVPMVAGGLITLGARASFERDAKKVLDEARDA